MHLKQFEAAVPSISYNVKARRKVDMLKDHYVMQLTH